MQLNNDTNFSYLPLYEMISLSYIQNSLRYHVDLRDSQSMIHRQGEDVRFQVSKVILSLTVLISLCFFGIYWFFCLFVFLWDPHVPCHSCSIYKA